MRSKSRTLLIIGGTGFFGKSILDYILRFRSFKNINKILLLSRGVHKIKIHSKLKKKIKVISIYGDIAKLKKIPFADYVIYCVIIHNYKQDYKAVCNYYKLAKKYHSKSQILYTSSGAVYGEQPEHLKRFNEIYLFKNKRLNFKNKDRNMYSIVKLKSEKIFEKLGQFGIKVSIARCFAFVGKFLPRKSNFVVGNFIQSILDKKFLELKANYKVYRSYMHADDLAQWLLKIVSKANNMCPTYNVGSDHSINIRTLGAYLAKNNKLSFKFNKIESNFIDVYLPSVNKAKKELKLKLKYNSLDAINNTINSLKKDPLYKI
jgi:dTDP-glucose 4,6-dehydratase